MVAGVWDAMAVEFQMIEAAVTAILTRGGAIHEAGLVLTVQDGRVECHTGPDDDDDEDETRSELEYKCFVNVVGAKPEAVESQEGTIHIDGRHQNGQRLTIRGEGWIGRDQDGSLEVIFDYPPRMVIYPQDYEDEEDEDDGAGQLTGSLGEAADNVVNIPRRPAKSET